VAVIAFRLDGVAVSADPAPHETLLEWLRGRGKTGVKEGCAEGDCGACTVVVVEPGGARRTVNSCLVLVPSLQGRSVWTVHGLARPGGPLHPAQAALVDTLGSQCGFCTPGFVMCLVEACHRDDLDVAWRRADQLSGNLCRCTGYRPIREALDRVAGTRPDDVLAAEAPLEPNQPVVHAHADGVYLAPTDWDALWEALAAHPAARVVAGTTDVGLDVTQRHARYAAVIDLSRLPALQGVTRDGAVWRIGAATPLADVEAWSADAVPVLHRALRYFGSRPIKHRGTVGGNVCTASPIGDLAPVFLALDAVAEVMGPAGRRDIPFAAWFVGYRTTALAPGEVLAAVRVAPVAPGVRHGAYKVSRRRELDISAVSACLLIEERDGRVARARFAFGGMAATPTRCREAEAVVEGQPWTAASAARAAEVVSATLSPIDDVRGSAWYRRTVAANLVRGFYDETADLPFRPLADGHAGTVGA
jgi:xanthine dehydrogenase small subunit